jgi:hypothetical protein
MNWVSLLLAAGAVWLLAGKQLASFARTVADKAPQIERRHLAAAALLAAAAVMWTKSGTPSPSPTPAPPAPDMAIDLRGKFIGPDAAADAAAVAAHFDELADELEYDGMASEPLMRSGVAWDELRTRAKALRWRGQSLGERHPAAREAIRQYLDQAAGTSGGPMSPAQRAAWVSAYREIARAADVSR